MLRCCRLFCLLLFPSSFTTTVPWLLPTQPHWLDSRVLFSFLLFSLYPSLLSLSISFFSFLHKAHTHINMQPISTDSSSGELFSLSTVLQSPELKKGIIVTAASTFVSTVLTSVTAMATDGTNEWFGVDEWYTFFWMFFLSFIRVFWHCGGNTNTKMKKNIRRRIRA